MTLGKLLKDKELGKVNVRISEWNKDYYFTPFYESRFGAFYGLTQAGESRGFDVNSSGWELYTEPKKKVLRAQYIYKHVRFEEPYITDRLFKDDSDFVDQYSKPGMEGGIEWYKRLEEIECES